LFIKH